MKKNHRFVVVVTCQGNPNYYYRNTLFGGLIEYAYQYLKKSKYGTMNFILRQEFDMEVKSHSRDLEIYYDGK